MAIVRRYRKKGHITQAFFKVATGGSTGVICNCCPDCCVSLKATAVARCLDPGLSMNAPAGYRVRYDAAWCTQCGKCTTVCHFEAVRQRFIAAAERIFEVLDIEPDIRDAPDAHPLPPVTGRVRFQNVGFAYSDLNETLQDVNLDVAPGEMVRPLTK